MSYHTWGNSGYTINWDKLRAILPVETKALEGVLEEQEISIDQFCETKEYPDDPLEVEGDQVEYNKCVDAAWLEVVDAFERKTRPFLGHGLLLQPSHHNQDEGDGNDDVSGGFFYVSDVEKVTRAGKKGLALGVTLSFWVTSG